MIEWVGIGFMMELDDRFSEAAKMLVRLAPKASMEAVCALPWNLSHGWRMLY